MDDKSLFYTVQTYLSFKNNLFPQVQKSEDKYLQITRNCLHQKNKKNKRVQRALVAYLRKRSKVTVEPFTEDH